MQDLTQPTHKLRIIIDAPNKRHFQTERHYVPNPFIYPGLLALTAKTTYIMRLTHVSAHRWAAIEMP